MPTVPPARLEVEIANVCPAAETAILKDFVAVLLLASVTLMVKVEVPDAVGVPVIAPDDAFKVRPAGREPVLTLHVYGVVPPVACTVAEYAVPTVPPARLDVEIANCPAAATAMLKDWVAVLLLASCTWAVKVEVPDAVGVPVIAPDDAFKVRPAGSEPLLMLHVYGAVPPVACSVAEYAVLTLPPGKEAVEIARDAPDPPPVLVLAVTPAHPFNIASDATKTPMARCLDRLPANNVWSRASMIVIPFSNLREELLNPLARTATTRLRKSCASLGVLLHLPLLAGRTNQVQYASETFEL